MNDSKNVRRKHVERPAFTAILFAFSKEQGAGVKNFMSA